MKRSFSILLILVLNVTYSNESLISIWISSSLDNSCRILLLIFSNMSCFSSSILIIAECSFSLLVSEILLKYFEIVPRCPKRIAFSLDTCMFSYGHGTKMLQSIVVILFVSDRNKNTSVHFDWFI